jgi:transcription initiation factor TFIIIB Brf1 subunit/transcription initiation factor TFIIB
MTNTVNLIVATINDKNNSKRDIQFLSKLVNYLKVPKQKEEGIRALIAAAEQNQN